MARAVSAIPAVAPAAIAAVAAVAFGLGLGHAAPPARSAACDPAAITLEAASGPVTFAVEIADDAEERARGLMYRPALPRDSGMLFLFDPPRRVSFWMRNTMIPLDMIFIDETGRVESIAERTDTHSDRGSASRGEVRAVLEINAGLSRALGIAPGAQAVHPAFGTAHEGARCPGGPPG